MTPPEAAAVRFMEPRVRPIARATDLGSVQVLKHGNVYLLTDQFGDIHPDSRGLGLYRTDTRLLSCSVLHVGGERPVLLQGSMGGNYRGAIQLTNPSADRNPDMKVHPLDDLVGRTIGISRDRLIGRRRPRGAGPHRQPRGSGGHDHGGARHGHRRRRHLRGPRLPASRRAGRSFRWRSRRSGSRSATTGWTGSGAAPTWRSRSRRPRSARWPRCRPTRSTPGPRSGCAGASRSNREPPASCAGPSGPTRPPCPPDAAAEPRCRDASSRSRPSSRATKAPRRTAPGTHGTTTVDSDHELFDRVMERSIPDLRLLVNDGPGPDERYIAAGVPWFATLFGRDSIIASFQSLAFRPQVARRDAVRAGRLPGHRGRRPARRGARQDPPRAADRRDGRGRRAAAHAVLRLGRFDAALADPPRRDLRLDRGPRPASTGCGRTRWPRSSGSTRTATATATGSSSTSAGRSAAC